MIPLLARLRRADVPCVCPLIGVNRKWLADGQNDANDPIETSAAPNGDALDAGFSPYRSTSLSR